MSGLQYNLAKLQALEERSRLGDGANAIERHKSQGKLLAWERIERLLDEGTFVELNALAQHQGDDFGMRERKIPGDGVVTGFGTIAGRPVFVFAQDATFMKGSLGLMHIRKICYLIDKARENGCPIIGLHESAGGRIQDATDVIGRGEVFYKNVLTSGVVPQISAIMGTCVGGSVYSPALTDFVLMVTGTGKMFITGPDVIKTVTGQDVTMEELGGARVHSEVAGTVDLTASDDLDCLALIRRLLEYLPSNNLADPPWMDTGDPPGRILSGIEKIVPDDPRKAFDMRHIIVETLDAATFFEIKPDYAKNIIVGFGRLAGHVVGVVANQPAVNAGVLDINASDKASRFIRICDSYNIPIITFVDVPGFMPGVDQEHGGIIRHGAKMLYAYSEATVPKLTVVIRKDYGGAIPAMCSKQIGADLMIAWPNAEFAVMGAEAAVNILYKSEIRSALDPDAVRAKRLEEYRAKFEGPFDAAGKMYVDAVIRPWETRKVLTSALEVLRRKQCSVIPRRKHGIMPQ